MIKFILLGFLNYQPMTGYDLKQTIDESSAHFWHAYHSQIYTTLRKMEQEGLVTSQFIQEDSTPDRRVYTITPSGKKALKAWLDKTLTEMSPVKEELLVRLFFSAQRDPQEVLTELRLQRELHQEKAAAYQAIGTHITTQIPKKCGLERDEKFWRLTLDMGMRYEEMYLAWLDASIRTIEAL
jgi:PadR family transcriptional regulator, regulatory protein AphA